MNKRRYRFGISYIQSSLDKWNRKNRRYGVKLIVVPAKEYYEMEAIMGKMNEQWLEENYPPQPQESDD